jgi:hypothetical protein
MPRNRRRAALEVNEGRWCPSAIKRRKTMPAIGYVRRTDTGFAGQIKRSRPPSASAGQDDPDVFTVIWNPPD